MAALATLVALLVPSIYGMFILAADFIYVVMFPQLVCAVYVPWANGYGSLIGYISGILLRLGAGEPYINLEPFIRYPFYSEGQQLFPVRTFAMLISWLLILTVSYLTAFLFRHRYLADSWDILHCVTNHTPGHTVGHRQPGQDSPATENNSQETLLKTGKDLGEYRGTQQDCSSL